MGAIGGMLGTAGGASGTGFNINSGTDQNQLTGAYAGQQAAMGAQNDLLSAIQKQQGLQNQSNVYGQLQGVVNGQGPNPAQAQLAQATGANVANQAALMAGQRGAGSNVGLMARQAGQQGMNAQQQAAGQAATMQANQSLGALGQAGSMANVMAGNQIGQTNANVSSQQNEQNILQNANTANNQIQGQLANTAMQGQQQMVGGIMNGASSLMSMVAHGGEIQNFDDGGQAAFGPQSMFAQNMSTPSQAPSMPTFSAAAPQKSSGGGGGAGGLLKLALLANGGTVPMADGGAAFSGPSMFSQFLGATPAGPGPSYSSSNPGAAALGAAASNSVQKMGAQKPVVGKKIVDSAGPDIGVGTPVPSMVAAKGGNVGSALKQGGHVPGKAKVAGDSLKNDNVKALLSPGEVVIPRSVMNSKDPIRGAAEFVRATMAKKGKRA